MSATDATPTPSVPAEKITLKTALTDAEVALGALVTVGEGILVAVPGGPLTSAIQIGLPVVAAVLAALRKIGG